MTRRSNDNTETVRGTLKRETDKAILLVQGSTEAWLPKSQIGWDESADIDDEIEVIVPEWLIDQHGLDIA